MDIMISRKQLSKRKLQSGWIAGSGLRFGYAKLGGITEVTLYRKLERLKSLKDGVCLGGRNSGERV